MDDQRNRAGRFGKSCKEHTGLGGNPDTSAWETELPLIKCTTGQVIFPLSLCQK